MKENAKKCETMCCGCCMEQPRDWKDKLEVAATYAVTLLLGFAIGAAAFKFWLWRWLW